MFRYLISGLAFAENRLPESSHFADSEESLACEGEKCPQSRLWIQVRSSGEGAEAGDRVVCAGLVSGCTAIRRPGCAARSIGLPTDACGDLPQSRMVRPLRRRSRLMSPASTVSASAVASIGRHCDACSMCWSGDDSDPLGRTGLAGGRRTDMRRGMSGLARQVQEAIARRSACRRSLRF